MIVSGLFMFCDGGDQYAATGRRMQRTLVFVDEVHKVRWFALRKGDQGKTERKGCQVPWPREGR